MVEVLGNRFERNVQPQIQPGVESRWFSTRRLQGQPCGRSLRVAAEAEQAGNHFQNPRRRQSAQGTRHRRPGRSDAGRNDLRPVPGQR